MYVESRTRLFILAALLLLSALGTVRAEDPTHFRKSTWGQSPEDVIQVEGKPFQKDESNLVYKADVMGLSALTLYKFSEDRLHMAGYVFQEKHTNKNDYIADYRKAEDCSNKEIRESRY